MKPLTSNPSVTAPNVTNILTGFLSRNPHNCWQIPDGLTEVNGRHFLFTSVIMRHGYPELPDNRSICDVRNTNVTPLSAF